MSNVVLFKVDDSVGYLWHDLEIQLNVADFLKSNGQPEHDQFVCSCLVLEPGVGNHVKKSNCVRFLRVDVGYFVFVVIIGDQSWQGVKEGTSDGFFRGDPNVGSLGTPVDGVFWEEVDVVVWQFEADEVQCGDLVFADFDFSKSISRVGTGGPVEVVDFLSFGSCRCKYF